MTTTHERIEKLRAFVSNPLTAHLDGDQICNFVARSLDEIAADVRAGDTATFVMVDDHDQPVGSRPGVSYWPSPR